MKYPLLSNAFSNSDILEGQKVLRSKQITMSSKTKMFEKKFARYIGSKYALMVNSGSSANLLALSLLTNPMRKKRLMPGDEVIVPVVCWSTSLWPIIQHGLKPIFVDIDLNNLNIDLDKLKKKITKRTKAIFCVHVLGLSADMFKLKKIAQQKKLMIIEDTCESFGTRLKNKFLGTFGEAGTYSFYYSHQITSGEGGMITCNNKEDYEILLSLRSHGWAREKMIQKKYKKNYPSLDPRFLFINSGYNLRPTEIQAAIALNQFKRKNVFKENREFNRNKIIEKVKSHKKFCNQINFLDVEKNIDPSWFGLAVFIDERYSIKKSKYLNYLEKKGIETRPIISGNFANQPAVKLYKLNKSNEKFKNAQIIENLGFFIGLHTKKIDSKLASYISSNLLMINEL
jgi:CDP-4-dehydro-6-deoxyglucose reductase, E1